MNKIFAGLLGLVLVMSGANAANEIQTATTNTVKKSVYDINYGADANPTANAPTYGYRSGVYPQTNKLATATGTTTYDNGVTTRAGGSNVTVAVGNLADAGTPVTSNGTTVGYSGDPTATITANSANIAVLQRDKLVTATASSSCTSGVACGYVTTGSHANTPGTSDKVWLKIEPAPSN